MRAEESSGNWTVHPIWSMIEFSRLVMRSHDVRLRQEPKNHRGMLGISDTDAFIDHRLSLHPS